MKQMTEILNKYIKELYDNYLIDGNEISDTIHTFGELYDFRMLYNALAVNALYEAGKALCYKTERHSDGELCFGGGWFLVVIDTPYGKIDNHYKMEYWDYFKCPILDQELGEYDGHTTADVADCMRKYILNQ